MIYCKKCLTSPVGFLFFIKIINILRRNICTYQKIDLLLTRINNLKTVI